MPPKIRNPRPTMTEMWSMIRLLQDRSPAGRESIKDLYERRGTVPHSELWNALRRAALACIEERGKGLTPDEYAEFTQLMKDWPFSYREDPPPPRSRINLAMPEELLARITEAAHKDKISYAEFIRRAAAAELSRRDQTRRNAAK